MSGWTPTPGARVRARRVHPPKTVWPDAVWLVTDVHDTAFGPIVIVALAFNDGDHEDHGVAMWADEWQFRPADQPNPDQLTFGMEP